MMGKDNKNYMARSRSRAAGLEGRRLDDDGQQPERTSRGVISGLASPSRFDLVRDHSVIHNSTELAALLQ